MSEALRQAETLQEDMEASNFFGITQQTLDQEFTQIRDSADKADRKKIARIRTEAADALRRAWN